MDDDIANDLRHVNSEERRGLNTLNILFPADTYFIQ